MYVKWKRMIIGRVTVSRLRHPSDDIHRTQTDLWVSD